MPPLELEKPEARRRFLASCVATAAVLVAMLGVYGAGGRYVDALVAPSSTDLVLRNIPRWDATWILSYGWMCLHAFTLATVFLLVPRRMPYIFATVSLFIAIRVVFLVLTPLGPPAQNLDMTRINPLFALGKGMLTFNNENFFSGHTGLPYLFFLIHREPWLKAVFLAASILMGTCVLLARNHYAIDVLGAYFTTYAIYRLSRWTFGRLDPVAA
jgi:hypothetical protein